jgi:hypothetical protein
MPGGNGHGHSRSSSASSGSDRVGETVGREIRRISD